MGSEQARNRKHLFLCLACSIMISLVTDGCVHFHIKQEGEEDLTRARSLMSQGLFEASFRESQEVLRRYPQSQGDQALFQMGLIYLHPQNPNVDYQKSLGYFQRLEREFPDSQMRSEAEIWVSLLQKSLKTEEDILGKAIKAKELQAKELEKQRIDLEKIQEKRRQIEEKYYRTETRFEQPELRGITQVPGYEKVLKTTALGLAPKGFKREAKELGLDVKGPFVRNDNRICVFYEDENAKCYVFIDDQKEPLNIEKVALTIRLMATITMMETGKIKVPI